jgi:hypothetical protein
MIVIALAAAAGALLVVFVIAGPRLREVDRKLNS